MNYRVFTAIDLTPNVIQKIVDYEKSFQKQFPTILRWTKSDQLHLTLKFVGELGEKDLKLISEELHENFSTQARFPLDFSGSGIFPSLKSPRIFWIGIQSSAELLKLFKKNEESFQKFGYSPEKRPFQGHITIGRFKENSAYAELEQFLSYWQSIKQDFHAQQVIDHLTFYQSTLTSQGPIYKVITKVDFQ